MVCMQECTHIVDRMYAGLGSSLVSVHKGVYNIL